MRRLFLLLAAIIQVVILSLEGCSHIALTLEHTVLIPSAYSSADRTEAGESPAQRYRDAYERGWRNCIAERKKTLDEPCRNIAASGWSSEVFGYADGSIAADERVNQLIKSYGKDKTHSYLINH